MTPLSVDRPVYAKEGFPLSPLQQGMLFHYVAAPRSGVDVEQMVIELNEQIDPKVLEVAWSETAQNQPVLRTQFVWSGLGKPVQREVDSVAVPFTTTDLRQVAPQESERQIARYLEHDRTQGFDLQRPPLLRCRLFTIAENKHQLIWTFHHILIDGRSFTLILEEVFERYCARRRGEQSVHKSGISFREYVSWLASLDTSGAAEFWRNKLSGITHSTHLPFCSQGRHATSQPLYGEVELELTPSLTDALKKQAASAGLTLNNLVMGAWAILLYRYSGEQEIVFGATKTTRKSGLPGAEDMVGLFLATLPIRLSVAPGQSFCKLLKSLREYWISLRLHEHTSLVEIKRASSIAGDAPLFDSLVVFESNRFGDVLRDKGGDWSNRKFRLFEQSNYGLTLCAYGGEQLLLKLEFDARRFERLQAIQLLNHLEIILQPISSGLNNLVDDFPLLTPGEQVQILHDFNATAMEYPREVPLAELIESQVAGTPDATAVVFEGKSLSYRELNERANQLARELMKHGAKPDELVGICVERSLEMMIALLAVVKSGAAYVPLDPHLPPSRLQHILADTDLRAVLTQNDLLSSLPPFDGGIVTVESGCWRDNDRENLGIAVKPEHLAYVIYTSGSAGKPKGVQVSYGSLVNLLWSVRELLQFTASDRLLAVATISFDIAGADIWLPWLVGAKTILASHEAAADGAQLRSLIEQHDITFMQATPVTWWLLLGAGWRGKPDAQIVCTGEAMPRDLSARLAPIVRRLWNLYGPTETTIWSTGYLVENGEAPILIGRPVGNTQCYILDEQCKPVPLGAIGELHVAGDGVARGYLNRPELTAEKFVPDLFGVKPGARMYRTGDLARYLPDGNIECLGRNDYQVKIRGFRIELGEIETALKQHSGIRRAVVVAREDTPNNKRLVAYFVPAANQAPKSTELRNALKQQLPNYMIPADYVALTELPISANGKIDRKRLPAPSVWEESCSVAESCAAPRTEMERKLVEIFSKVLSIQQVGIHDDFFDLGGDSLTALEAVSLIEREFKADLPVRLLFQAQTASNIAAILGATNGIEPAQSSHSQPTLIPIQPNGSRCPLFCVARPNVNSLGYLFLSRQLGPNQPVYGLQKELQEDPEVDFTHEQIETTAAEYIREMRSVQPRGPYLLIGQCQGAYIAFEMARQLEDQGERLGLLGMLDVWPEENTRYKPVFFAYFCARQLLKLFRAKRATTQDASAVLTAGTKNGVTADQRTKSLIGSRQSKRLWAYYWPGRDFKPPVLHCRITAFRVVRQQIYRIRDYAMGWGTRSLGGVEVEEIPGDHSTFLQEPHVKVLAEKISRRIDHVVPSSTDLMGAVSNKNARF